MSVDHINFHHDKHKVLNDHIKVHADTSSIHHSAFIVRIDSFKVYHETPNVLNSWTEISDN